MHQLANGFDIAVEEAQRIRAGQHQTGDIRRQFLFQILQVDIALRIGRHFPATESGDRRAGRVGAVGGVRNQHHFARLVAARPVIGGDHHHAGQFAVRSGHRLHRAFGHAHQFGQNALSFEEHRQRPLRQSAAMPQLRQQRMQFGKARQRRQMLMKFRVVLHRAGAQRIEIGVHAHIPAAEIDEMPHRFQLRHFRQRRRCRPPQFRRNRRAAFDVALRQRRSPASRPALLKNQLHNTASIALAKFLISSRVRFSVTATSSCRRRSS